MLQYLIVALTVGAALLYSVWALLPAAVRVSAAAGLARWAAHLGMTERKAQRLQSTLASAGTCSECAQCKGCASSKPQPGNADAAGFSKVGAAVPDRSYIRSR